MNLQKTITLNEQERCNGEMMSTMVLKNSRVSNPAIFSKNFASGSILSISKNYLTQFNLHSPLERKTSPSKPERTTNALPNRHCEAHKSIPLDYIQAPRAEAISQ